MRKTRHEVRDGLYGFIEFDNLDRALIDSKPFQRLRNIHQLAMTYQVYPGATHRRFEHALGVMDCAGRIFDVLFRDHLSDAVRERTASELEDGGKAYWRRVVRLGALLHDVGHLPFSHAAEEELLPKGWNHERITAEIIRSGEIADILKNTRPQIDPEDVVDVCWDVRKRSKVENKVLTPLKALLNEIITGNTFGADRIDYLLRDSWHVGVAYGRFDPERLIRSLRVVIDPNTEEVALGLDHGGIHAAEGLLLARYFMYTQVYFHDVRRSYDIHLKDFLKAWLPGGIFPTDLTKFLQWSDNEILAGLWTAAVDASAGCHELAVRVLERKHFRTVFELNPSHMRHPKVLDDLHTFAQNEFGSENVRVDFYGPKAEFSEFWVDIGEDRPINSLEVSDVIARIPPFEIGMIFVDPSKKDQAVKKVRAKFDELLADKKSEGEEGCKT